MAKSQTDPKWANNKLMDFVLYQKERVYKNQIVYATIRNYLKTVKLFLEIRELSDKSSEQFLRFAESALTNNKNDSQHSPV